MHAHNTILYPVYCKANNLLRTYGKHSLIIAAVMDYPQYTVAWQIMARQVIDKYYHSDRDNVF